MNLRQIKCLIFNTLISGCVLAQQNTILSSNSNLMQLNPSLIGENSESRINANYLFLTPTDFHYTTYGINAYHYLTKAKAYVGINTNGFKFDNLAKENLTSACYVQNIRFKNLLIKPFIESGLYHSKIDFSKLTFGSGTNYDSLTPKIQYWVLNAGFSTHYKKFTFGFTSRKLNNPEYTNYFNTKIKSKPTYGFQLGYHIDISKNASLKPFLMYHYNNGFQNLMGGTSFHFASNYSVGVSFSSSSDILFRFAYQNNNFEVNYTIQNQNSKFDNFNRVLYHQIGLSFKFNSKEENRNQELHHHSLF
jgi:hypothetical protein